MNTKKLNMLLISLMLLAAPIFAGCTGDDADGTDDSGDTGGGGDTNNTTGDNTTGDNTTGDNTTSNETSTLVEHSVNITDSAFDPSVLNITVGDNVTWTNQGSMTHTVTSDGGEFTDSSDLANGDTYTVTFDTAGTYTYHCNYHNSSMTATINVA